MYNEDNKKLFIQEAKWKTATIPTVENYFNLLEQTERKFDIDLSEMTGEQIFEAIKKANRETALDVVTLVNLMKRYCSWCYAEDPNRAPTDQVKFINEFDPLDYLDELIVFPACLDFENITSRISEVYSTTDGHLIWPAAVLAWIGLSVPEIINLKNEDIIWNKKQVNIGQEFFQFNRKIYDILKVYASTETGWREQNRVFQVSLIDVGYFLKPSVTKNSKKTPSQITSKQIAAAFTNFNLLYGKKHDNLILFSHNYIWRMGAFDRLKQLDMETDGGIENATPKAISAAYRTLAKNRTKKLILAEYNIYKKKVAEVVK